MLRPCTAGVNRHGIAFSMLCGLAASAPAATDGVGLPSSESTARAYTPADSTALQFDFSLPAQALAAALERFSIVSGRSALFSSALVADRISSPVRGRYTAGAALQILLAGTGLAVEEVSAGHVVAFVLKSSDSVLNTDPDADPQALAAAAAEHRLDNYDSLVQARVWEAICANSYTASGSYRSLLRFRVDAAGRIGRARLLGSTGDRDRDLVLLDILQRVRIDHPPPPDMAQPLTMLILPERTGGPVCTGGSAGKP